MGVSHYAAKTAIALALILAACSGGGDDKAGDARDEPAATTTTTEPAALPADYEGYTSAVYGDDASWLCSPDLPDDACAQDLDATAVEPDGSLDVVTHEPSGDPGIDCFYVYPTVSGDPGTNSDMVVGPEETNVVYNQAARLTSTCRVFAPMYRQVTLAMIGGGGPAPPPGVSPFATAYGDVVDAFKSYIANDRDGRGFVLIGHSQGAGLLERLLEDEIDDEPLLRDRLVAAYILGAAVHVPAGEVVGGDLGTIPLCEADDQTGCVVSYATFRATAPPSTGSFFGRSNDVGPAACVNPAAPSGGSGTLHPFFLAANAQPFADTARTGEITTPFVTYPEFVEAECMSQDGYTWLSLTVNGDPADARTDDIRGDLPGGWGMHLIDVNVAMGDIEALVTSQAEAYLG
jgi:Protein of unknown function (DUF3089)